jgi:hypothetical protein
VVNEWNWVLAECLGSTLKPVDKLRTADPQGTLPILKESADEDSTDTVLIVRVGHKQFQAVPVKPVQAILGSEPEEALIVLYNLADFTQISSAGARKTSESDICSIDDGQVDGPRIYDCLGHFALHGECSPNPANTKKCLRQRLHILLPLHKSRGENT